MHRLFVDQVIKDCPCMVRVESQEEVHHALRVLRLSEGDHIELTDAAGGEFIAEIKTALLNQASENVMEVLCLEKIEINRESPVEITLFQGLPKHDKLEFIIQKAVELGAVKIVPVECERSVAKIRDAKDAGKKTERWNRIAHEAAKQSKRAFEPGVTEPIRLKAIREFLSQDELKLLAYEGAALKPLMEHLEEARRRDDLKQRVAVMIGPEGGLTEKEVNQLNEMGFITIGLGPRILRTETAGLALLSIIQYVLGDMGGR
jgi:16S rRNA (uracil1498-N3)-methyltransferase